MSEKLRSYDHSIITSVGVPAAYGGFETLANMPASSSQPGPRLNPLSDFRRTPICLHDI
jgi:hypothetical protein